MSSNDLILHCPLLFPPSIFTSIRVFSNESVLCIRWPEYWSFSISISPSSEYSELISYRIDWLDLRAVQGTLKSLLQHHSSKASILRHSAFLTVQLSHPYMTTGKTIALTLSLEKVKSKLMRYYLIPTEWMAVIKKSANSKCWTGYGEKGTLLHCWWECKLVEPIQRTVWRFPKITKIEPSYDPATLFLGIYPQKTIIWKVPQCSLPPYLQ